MLHAFIRPKYDTCVGNGSACARGKGKHPEEEWILSSCYAIKMSRLENTMMHQDKLHMFVNIPSIFEALGLPDNIVAKDANRCSGEECDLHLRNMLPRNPWLIGLLRKTSSASTFGGRRCHAGAQNWAADRVVTYRQRRVRLRHPSAFPT